MRCRRVQHRLGRYLDGELSPEAAGQVRRHLEGCPRCRSELEGLSRLGALLGGVEGAAQVPEGFAARVRRLAESHIVSRRTPVVAGGMLVRYATAGALLLGGSLGILMSQNVASLRSAGAGASEQQVDLETAAEMLGLSTSDPVSDVFQDLMGES